MQRAKGLEGQYLNCRLFVQLVTKTPDLEGMPIVKSMQPGDVLQFGENPARHWAIFIGNGDVLEIPEWGSKSHVTKLAPLLNEYDEPIIRRPQ